MSRWVDIDTIKPHPKNPKDHDEKQITEIAESIKGNGWGKPIILSSDDYILAGHGSYYAARKLQYKKVKVDYLEPGRTHDEPEAISYLLADNKLAEKSKWSPVKLDPIFDELKLQGADLQLTGFSEKEIDKIQNRLDPTNAEDDNFDIETVKEFRVKPGEVWQLGDHRLMCGDSTDYAQVMKLMDGRLANMIFTDPPYNVDYDPEQRHSYFSPERTKNKLGTIENDKKSPQAFKEFLDKVYSNMGDAVEPGRGIYICHADTQGHHFRNAFMDQGWKLQSCLIWKKTVLVFGRVDYHWIHEPILYGWKEGAPHQYHGDRKQTTVMEFATDHYNKKECDTDGYVHPTQKPLRLIGQCIKNSSLKDELVLDLFGGSGSTLMACQQLQRQCNMMELEPKYCDIIIARWENYTGQKATKKSG